MRSRDGKEVTENKIEEMFMYSLVAEIWKLLALFIKQENGEHSLITVVDDLCENDDNKEAVEVCRTPKWKKKRNAEVIMKDSNK